MPTLGINYFAMRARLRLLVYGLPHNGIVLGGYPWAPTLNGGFTGSELPSRDGAIARAARIAKVIRVRHRFPRWTKFKNSSTP